jgi:hypothetical protein
VGSSIAVATATSQSGDVSSTGLSLTATTIPTTLPRIISPNGGIPPQPNNSTLIQLGFTYGLNYPFVVNSSEAVAQIFSYLPPGVTYGLNIDQSEMVMQYLQPYNTISTLGYITTLAMAYIPAQMVDPLSLLLLNPNSALYTNPNPSVRTLMSMINPSIPVLAGSSVGGGTSLNSATAAGASPTSPNSQGAPDDANSSSPVVGKSVGIGVAAVAGAALYGAAMFFVARRYKRKRANHTRSSSVLSGGGNRRPGEVSALMSGGVGAGYRSTGRNSGGSGSTNSSSSGGTQVTGRTYISPPVMAENSLGWN